MIPSHPLHLGNESESKIIIRINEYNLYYKIEKSFFLLESKPFDGPLMNELDH